LGSQNAKIKLMLFMDSPILASMKRKYLLILQKAYFEDQTNFVQALDTLQYDPLL
jgi:hypothetical protein